jgi:hypothetical protein
MAQGETLNAIVYGQGRFVAVGGNGTIVTSPDGVIWSRCDSGTANGLDRLAYANGIFLAAGFSGVLFHSADGINWNPVAWDPLYRITGLGAANDRFILLTSTSGIPDFHAAIFSSSTGTNWSRAGASKTGVRLYDVTFANSLYVAVGSGPSPHWKYRMDQSPLVLTSPDAKTWTDERLDLDFFSGFERVAYGNGIIVAVVDGIIAFSDDASKWNPFGGYGGLLSVAFGDGFFVAVGHFGNIISSKDCISWKQYNTGNIYFLTDVAYGNNTFVVLGARGRIYQSDPILALELSKGLPAQLSLRGPLGRSCLIELADALVGTNPWTAVATVSLTNNPTTWVDSDSAAKPQRFYRAVLKP